MSNMLGFTRRNIFKYSNLEVVEIETYMLASLSGVRTGQVRMSQHLTPTEIKVTKSQA